MKVCVIGDACLDFYHAGSAVRSNPEASAPLLSNVVTTQKNGMALNVVENLLNFGLEVDAFTPAEPLSEKHRYIDKTHGTQYLRVDFDRRAGRIERLPDCSDYHAVFVCDYDKGFLNRGDVIELSQSSNVYIDTKKSDLRGAGDAIFKINETEYNALRYQPKNLIVTYGSMGAAYKGVLYEAERLEAVDVCGAGDTFLAALGYKLAKSNSMEKSIRFANICAGITCTKRGAYAPKFKEIHRRHRWHDLHTD